MRQVRIRQSLDGNWRAKAVGTPPDFGFLGWGGRVAGYYELIATFGSLSTAREFCAYHGWTLCSTPEVACSGVSGRCCSWRPKSDDVCSWWHGIRFARACERM